MSIVFSFPFALIIKSKGDPVPVHKQAHLNDRVGSVFFAFSILFNSIFLFDLKVIIGTVTIKDLIIPFFKKVAVFVNVSLNKVTFAAKNI